LQTESYRRVNRIKESILPIDECAARENFRKAAQLGCANSQVVLGQAYSKARLGCAKNPAIALHYFRLAARQGVPAADHEISTLFGFAKHGDIVTPNGFLAFKHARRAAEDGNIPSFWQVGHFYEKGVGVKPSFPKAREWYLKGAAKQDENCMMALDSLKSLSFGAT
jgi:TPR repeat protein